ncbi:MAG: dienelactone hydrolase family protein [Actinomycetia bacterium]|nr:dienelactone hydrolase family protein [Actinomycetes bacterium]
MELTEAWVEHRRDGQPIKAFRAQPARVATPLPAVLVIQEIWGPDAHIVDLARRFASAGYVALAPDLYSRGGRPAELAPERIEDVKRFLDTVPPSAWTDPQALRQAIQEQPAPRRDHLQETVGRLFGPRDTEGMLADLVAWVDYLEADPGSRGRPVGSTGYCMGGHLSFELAACEPRLRVALVYYGAAPDATRMAHIGCPVYGFYGERDPRITDAVPDVARAMREHGKTYEYRIYPGARHAFFNDTRAAYDVEAARDAWARTLFLFNQYLGG